VNDETIVRTAQERFIDDVLPEIMALPSERQTLGGWTIVDTFNGCVAWGHENSNLLVHATPFWERAEGIALQVDSYDGRVQEFPMDLPYALTGDDGRDAARYLRTMDAWLNGFVAALTLSGRW
jgi:hypothetical protein